MSLTRAVRLLLLIVWVWPAVVWAQHTDPLGMTPPQLTITRRGATAEVMMM